MVYARTCFKGIHAIRIVILTKKVARPIEILYRNPRQNCQGLTPEPLAIIIASPTPRKSPKININKVVNFGFKFRGFFRSNSQRELFIVNTLNKIHTSQNTILIVINLFNLIL